MEDKGGVERSPCTSPVVHAVHVMEDSDAELFGIKRSIDSLVTLNTNSDPDMDPSKLRIILLNQELNKSVMEKHILTRKYGLTKEQNMKLKLEKGSSNFLRYCCIIRGRMDEMETIVYTCHKKFTPNANHPRFQYQAIDIEYFLGDVYAQREEKCRQRWAYIFELPCVTDDIRDLIKEIPYFEVTDGTAAERLAKVRRLICETIHTQAYGVVMGNMTSSYVTCNKDANTYIKYLMAKVETKVGKMEVKTQEKRPARDTIDETESKRQKNESYAGSSMGDN